MMDVYKREYRYIPQLSVVRNSLPGQNPSADASILGQLSEPNTVSVALAQVSETNQTLTELGDFGKPQPSSCTS